MSAVSSKRKSSIKLLVGLIALISITIIILAYTAMSLRDVAKLTEKEIPKPNVPEAPRVEDPVFEDDPEPEPELSRFETKANSPTKDEMPWAIEVPGNPLVVILPGANSSLGHISIERYDSDGNATGQPLNRGTQVQIPDPNYPGEKIYFKVP